MITGTSDRDTAAKRLRMRVTSENFASGEHYQWSKQILGQNYREIKSMLSEIILSSSGTCSGSGWLTLNTVS